MASVSSTSFTGPENAFDHNTTSYWDGCCVGYPNQQLGYDIGEPRPVLSYSLASMDNECPVEWTFEGSTDGATGWEVSGRDGSGGGTHRREAGRQGFLLI